MWKSQKGQSLKEVNHLGFFSYQSIPNLSLLFTTAQFIFGYSTSEKHLSSIATFDGLQPYLKFILIYSIKPRPLSLPHLSMSPLRGAPRNVASSLYEAELAIFSYWLQPNFHTTTSFVSTNHYLHYFQFIVLAPNLIAANFFSLYIRKNPLLA